MAKKVYAVRLAPETIEALNEQAEREGVSGYKLAARLIAEGVAGMSRG